MKDIVIIGGPNGAGKTTVTPAIVPRYLGIREFVNADEIARGLSPFNSEAVAVSAARLMLERIRSLVADGQSFAFETTCSGRTHAGWLRQCKGAGWRIMLVFLWLPSPQIALARVAERVRAGGHSIPANVIIRRYRTGLINMRQLYLPLADMAAIYDNSDEERALVAERMPDAQLLVRDAARWSMIERVTK